VLALETEVCDLRDRLSRAAAERPEGPDAAEA
jgi:hypothetical protein